jgi:uncharacterized small protein (DUF1192 family)
MAKNKNNRIEDQSDDQIHATNGAVGVVEQEAPRSRDEMMEEFKAEMLREMEERLAAKDAEIARLKAKKKRSTHDYGEVCFGFGVTELIRCLASQHVEQRDIIKVLAWHGVFVSGATVSSQSTQDAIDGKRGKLKEVSEEIMEKLIERVEKIIAMGDDWRDWSKE